MFTTKYNILVQHRDSRSNQQLTHQTNLVNDKRDFNSRQHTYSKQPQRQQTQDIRYNENSNNIEKQPALQLNAN